MVRTPSIDKNGMKKGAWSQEEDNKLRAYIVRYGHSNWRQLPKYAGLSRCGKSCRLRWMNYLRPNLKLGNYTKEEDDIIMKLHEKHGNRWSAIAANLPGRTDNEIKNHWHTHLKKRGGFGENQATLELKVQEVETCQSEPNPIPQSPQPEVNHKIELLAPKGVVNISRLDGPMLENTDTLSPGPSSSQFSCDYAAADGGVICSKSFGESIGNFWTEPFVEDKWYSRNIEVSYNMLEGGFMSPYSSYNVVDDIDLFYQLMHDFRKD